MGVVVLVAAVQLAQLAAADSHGLHGRWVADRHGTVVSLEPCADDEARTCGYVVAFGPTGDSRIDRSLCGLQIIGALAERGRRLEHGWFLDAERQSVYRLALRPKSSRTMTLVLFVFGESDGVELSWKRTRAGGRDCRESSTGDRPEARAPG